MIGVNKESLGIFTFEDYDRRKFSKKKKSFNARFLHWEKRKERKAY